MDLSEKTRLEMEAGAKQLAIVNGTPLSPDYLAAVVRTQQRDAQLRRWIVEKKVKVEEPTRHQQGNVRYYNDPALGLVKEVTITVLPHKGGPTFTDAEALKSGGYPSEVLIANIALALQAMGEL